MIGQKQTYLSHPEPFTANKSACGKCLLDEPLRYTKYNGKSPDGGRKRSISKDNPALRHSCGLLRTTSLEVEDATVEVLIIADPPRLSDLRQGGYWKGGEDIVRSIDKRLRREGLHYLAIPAVRCFPGGDVDHFLLTKKYKGKASYIQESPLSLSRKAVGHCKRYVHAAIDKYQPKLILAMGPLATEALGLEGSFESLRSYPVHPVPGTFRSSSSGVVVTFDRAQAERDPKAQREVIRAVERLINIEDKCFPGPKGRRDTIDIQTLDTVDKVKRFVDLMLTTEFPERTVLLFDYETDGLNILKEDNKILNVGFSLSSQDDKSWVIPLYHPETPFSGEDLKEVEGHLARLLRAEGAKFWALGAHGAQFEERMTKTQLGVWVGEGGKPFICTQTMAYLENENRQKTMDRPYALETLATGYLDFTWYSETKIKGKRDKLSEEPIDVVNEYVGIDAAVTARLFNDLVRRLEAEGSLEDQLRLATKLYSPAIEYTTDMTLTGQAIDVDLLVQLRQPTSSIAARLKHIEKVFAEDPDVKQATKIIGKKNKVGGMTPLFGTKNTVFNMSSNEHMKVLFGEVLELSGAEDSVDKKFQEKHKNSHPLVPLYTEYNQLSKLDSAYLEPMATWLQHPNSVRDGRIRPSFNLNNTVTGRLSASNPNCQQQPRGDTRDKKQIKALFRASPGSVLVQLDYSQAEIRWLGILSGDEVLAAKYELADRLAEQLVKDPTNKDLKRRLKVDGDLHMSTALTMYRLPEDLPFTNEAEAKKKRQAAKSVAFGLVYGKSPKSLSIDLGIPFEETVEAVNLWLGQFPQAGVWLLQTEEDVVANGYVRSPFGRRRRLMEAFSQDPSVVNRAKRQSRNTPIQSAASDCCIYAACKLRKALMTHGDQRMREIKLINSVHDSLVAEVPAIPEVVEAYCRLAKSIFTDRNLLKEDWGVDITVPLAVDFDIGATWGVMRDYDFTQKALEKALHDAEVVRRSPPGTLWSDLEGKGLLLGEA